MLLPQDHQYVIQHIFIAFSQTVLPSSLYRRPWNIWYTKCLCPYTERRSCTNPEYYSEAWCSSLIILQALLFVFDIFMTPLWLSGSLRLHSGLSVSRVRCGMVSVVCIIMLSLRLMDHSRDFLTFPMLTVCQHTVCACIYSGDFGFLISVVVSGSMQVFGMC